MSVNEWQQDSDSLTTDDVEQLLTPLAPLITNIRTRFPAALDPETSEVDVDTLPGPLRHMVTTAGQLLTSHAELVRCGTSINQHWTPPDNLLV